MPFVSVASSSRMRLPQRVGQVSHQAVFASIYSLVVAAGLYGLFRNRSHAAVRMRNVELTFAAVVALHLYPVAVLVVLPFKDLFPCTAESWIMSIIFPTQSCGSGASFLLAAS